MAITLRQLAERVNATIVGNGDGDVPVVGCAPIDKAGPDEVTFLANRKYLPFLKTTRAAGVLIDPSTECPEHVTRLVCDDPYFAFRNALIELYGFRQHPAPMDEDPPGPIDASARRISAGARVHASAAVGEGTIIHPCAVVEAGAKIGRNCVLYPGVYVGVDTTIGDECLLHPNVTIYDRCVLGDRVTVHSSTVIGSDGFGYATHDGEHLKIPQTGIVVIEDDVELGAGCAIERAAMGETRIGRGTKFADLISIGHGSTIGAHCLFVSLVGISGSVDVGNYVVLGGQVGVTGHLKIGDGVQAAGKTAIVSDVSPGARIGGQPAIELEKAKRNALAGLDLYGLTRRVKQLEREIERLRRQHPDIESES
jgi:UDP-3-O-[3-hydroxymyristoyl] glucosamine N-acyltransferase